nr:paired amphipathic helix protein Sin3-like 3 isoform X1 [Tanacetum cinerariifolium]
MVLMVEQYRGEHLIRRFAGRGNEPDPRDVKIASLKQRIQELEFPQLQQNSSTKEAETESNVWDDRSEDVNPFGGGNPGFHDDRYDNPLLTKETESEPIIWDIGDEEEKYPFVNKYLNFQEEPIMSVEEESCPVYDTDNKEEELMPVYDTDIEEVIEEEDGDEKETSEDTELREHHTDDKDCDETHTRQILDHYVAELFHQELHGQMLCLREKVKERLRNSDDDVHDKDCDETHTRQILDHYVAELFHQELHGQMLYLREKVKERLRNSDDDVRKQIAPMVNKLGFKNIKEEINTSFYTYLCNSVISKSTLTSFENLEPSMCGGFIDKFVRDPNKTPDSSQRPHHNCSKCGNPIDGLYCRQCALLRKKLKEVWITICDENEIFQDFLNNFESSNDNTNVVNAPQEPFVFNQDPGEKSSQSPPHINHHYCYGCGDSLDGIFCQLCTRESCGNGAHIGYNCPPKVLVISNPEPCYNQNIDEFPQTLPSFHSTCYSGDQNSFTYDSNLNFMDDSTNPPPQPLTDSYEFCGNDVHYGHDYDDKDYTIAITPDFPIMDSLSMGDEHLSTILETESDELIKSSFENLVPNPSESKDLSYIENSLIISSPKIDSLLEEFFGELAYIDLIPPRINEADFDPEEDIRRVEKLLYDNLSPHPPGEPNFKNSDVVIESFSLCSIPVEGSDSLMEEIDIFLALDDSIPSGIENDDYDAEGDILFLKELLSNDSSSLPENESFHVPSSPC